MVRVKSIWVWIFVATTAIMLSGCTQITSIRPGIFQKAKEELRLPPPTPAPPLLIPDAASKPSLPNTKKAHYETNDLAPALIAVTAPASGKVTKSQSTFATLQSIHVRAAGRIASIPSYRARLRRREIVQGQPIREETVMQQFRRKPWSLAWEWMDGPSKGVRIVHVKHRDGRNVHWISPQRELALAKTNRAVELSLDDPKLRRVSRLPFDATGMETWIALFGRQIGSYGERKEKCGEFHYLGYLKRPEFETQVEAVMHVLPPECDPILPKGGQRLWFFDTTTFLPILIIAHDHQGREVGYFCLDRVQWQVPINGDAFNPPPSE